MLKSIYRKIHLSWFVFVYYVSWIFPINHRKIVFLSDSRTDISGNFEYILAEIRRRCVTAQCHFLLKNRAYDRKSLKELFALAYHIATARFVLLDDYYPIIYPLKIRTGTHLVQVWHAVGAFKKFGFSRVGLPGGPDPRSRDHRNYTMAVVSSKNVIPYYAEGFGIDASRVLPLGVPRTDLFFDKDQMTRALTEVRRKYSLPDGKQVILFAPTFRGRGQMSAYFPFEVLDMDRIYRELKDEFVFLLKFHPFVKERISIPPEFRDFFYDVSDNREINSLLLATDVLVTDYSSVCFEFALLERPMIFFAFDLEQYIRERDFYFDYYEFIPGTCVRTTEELIKTIKNRRFNMEKLQAFREYFFDKLDGQSSKRFLDWMIHEEAALL
ncbi:MAG: CDP-glycerol glycerophosphotransferase family protein [Alicyclobacillus herbarius]|uniref:CDP-glycerol glycerophosphotransferase family protein n=1 Tax=Alicyclobacillus herbarius TaxID=122960 RepID=UPI00138B16C5|nr:CDP-glycerol glycerophosphotransferase family protein [Alicyclobacillus herbarius]MCL6633661.1 CDP-glycerol glycerophosphotransferase family protein [Alicyclobacillus herbarius]